MVVDELSTMVRDNPVMLAGVCACGIGFFLLILGVFVFKLRALMNKRAWDGPTLPILKWGGVLFVLGGIATLVSIYWKLS